MRQHQHHHHDTDRFGTDGETRARRGEGPGSGRRGGPRRDDWRAEWHAGRGGHARRGPGGSLLGRGQRAARGDIRAAVLALTAEQPMHGYQIIRELGERSGGVWTPSPGSIYPTLQLLSDEGLVTSEDQDGRRVYSITDAGRAVLAERDADRPAPWDEVAAEADSSVVDLRQVAVQVIVAARQVAQAGSSAEIAKAKSILTEARRALYRILADGEPTGTAEDATAGDDA